MRKVLALSLLLLMGCKPQARLLPDYYVNGTVVIRWQECNKLKETTAHSLEEAEIIKKWLYMKYRIYK